METNSNRQKFISLAEKRVRRAIKDLRLIGNLSNRSNYSYEEDDVRQILGALQKELKRLKTRFENPSTQEEIEFHHTSLSAQLDLQIMGMNYT